MTKTSWIIAAAAFLADRGAKELAKGIPPEGMTLIPGVLGLRPVRNTGMAFSLLSGHPALLGILSLCVIAAAFLILRGKKLPALSRTGLMMMLGGALGNLTDRLTAGAVPDMIELLFMDFPIFNVADACLVVGCGLVILDLFRGEKHG